MDLVGYKLIDETGAEIGHWGGVYGQCPAVPNPVTLPSGQAHVHCADLDTDYVDVDEKRYRLIRWEMDAPPPVEEKSPQQKLADFLAANPDVLAAIEAMK